MAAVNSGRQTANLSWFSQASLVLIYISSSNFRADSRFTCRTNCHASFPKTGTEFSFVEETTVMSSVLEGERMISIRVMN